MKTTKVFAENLKAYNQYANSESGGLIVNQGGQGSSKTFSILQLLYIIAKYSKKKLKITICSYALPHLKGGAMADFEKILYDDNINIDDVKNKTNNFYKIGESIIEFIGIEGNESKATGPRRDILYVNEANRRIGYEVFELMNARTHVCTFIDYNPRAEFWYHTKIRDNFEHTFIKSTYLDNIYLPQRERDNILSKKDKPGFENWWRVYGLGEVGFVEGAILTNWRFGDFNNSLQHGYGLDFGSNDPDALVKCAIDKINKTLYWKEEVYQNGLSTDQLYKLIKSRNVGDKLIIADSAGKRTIQDFKFKGLNIRAVSKSQIVDDIKLLKDYEIIIDPESYNLEREINNWVWIDEKGELTLDDDNHLLDAARYYTKTILVPKVARKQMKLH
jgi:phage terminase large subunit